MVIPDVSSVSGINVIINNDQSAATAMMTGITTTMVGFITLVVLLIKILTFMG